MLHKAFDMAFYFCLYTQVFLHQEASRLEDRYGANRDNHP